MTIEQVLPVNTILQGDSLTKLKELPNDCIDCVITSPPYWALRDYKVDGQLGLEPTFNEYLAKLLAIFDEIKRVLKPSGTVFVNLGDTYSGNAQAGNKVFGNPEFNKNRPSRELTLTPAKNTGLKPKSLLAIPDRFKIAMIDRGWICRNEIIWYKRNCMPSSAKDRFTVDFEKIFFFTKNERYYFETQYEPYETADREDRKDGWPEFGGNKAEGYGNAVYSGERRAIQPMGRLKRTVWDITTQGFEDAHFATFPEELVENCIKPGCPEWVCNKCGKAREVIIENGELIKVGTNTRLEELGKKDDAGYAAWQRPGGMGETMIPGHRYERVFKGLTDCGCNAGFEGGICLDPFMGSGTVGLVAMKLARNFIGIELNSEYIAMAMKRLDPYLKQERLF